MDNWRNKDCKDCMFRVIRNCQRFPPTQAHPSGEGRAIYPIISVNRRLMHYDSKLETVYSSACAEYKESF